MRLKKLFALLAVLSFIFAFYYGLKQAYRLLYKLKYDDYSRLIRYPLKQKIDCPKQTAKTAVILAIGQSNVANYGEIKYKTHFPKNVFNYFNGHCYVAASPLLGAGGDNGEYLTLLADKLIQSKNYEQVVIVPSAIGNTKIAQWAENAPLNEMLKDSLHNLKQHYDVTAIIWHQGESDYLAHTTYESYLASFQSLTRVLRYVTTQAPLFLSITSRCFDEKLFIPANPIASAQRALIDDKSVFLGVDTDAFTSQDRQADACHLSKNGQEKAAEGFYQAITKRVKD